MKKEELEKIKEQIHRELIEKMQWRDDVIFVGALMGVILLALLLFITGVWR